MRVTELWRYPVKSLRGEQLLEAELLPDGIRGDRVVHVRSASGRLLTARARPRLLELSGTLDGDGMPLVAGRPWDSPEAAAAVGAAAGPGAFLRPSDAERFDVLPLSIATDGAIDAFAADRRRLRPNIVIGEVDGLAERDWPGRRLRVGAALVAVVKLRARCVMTTYDPDTLDQDLSVLRRIVSDFGGTMALDASVVSPGHVRIGDTVELLD
jgi:uncharacterized protein